MPTAEPGDRLVDGEYRAVPDPVSDMLLSLVMKLTAEVWTVRDRLRLVEAALAEHGVPVGELVEAIRGHDDAVDNMRADRDEFVARVLAPLGQPAPPD